MPAATLPTDLRDAWQRGKLDAECPACGRKEAASAKCSGCFRPYLAADYRTHADARALHHRDAPAPSAPAAHRPPIQAVSVPIRASDTAAPFQTSFGLVPEEVS